MTRAEIEEKKPRFSRMFHKVRGASWMPFERVLGAKMSKERNS